jgi:hypothetical protein
MRDPVDESDLSGAKARLRRILEEIYALAEKRSGEDQEALLRFFEHPDLQQILKDWRRGEQRADESAGSALIEGIMGDRVLKDFIGDIGTGGMFIETPDTFTTGETITLIFSPSHEEGPVKITGKIVWESEKGVGVKFTSAVSDLEEILTSL